MWLRQDIYKVSHAVTLCAGAKGYEATTYMFHVKLHDRLRYLRIAWRL